MSNKEIILCPCCYTKLDKEKTCVGCSSYDKENGMCLFYSIKLKYPPIRYIGCLEKSPTKKTQKKVAIREKSKGCTKLPRTSCIHSRSNYPENTEYWCDLLEKDEPCFFQNVE